MMDERKTKAGPIVFGEVLFDVFPDGKEILGGATLNAAWHLQGFGYHPLLISQIGDDERGKRIQEAMQSWGMDTRGLQTDLVHPTGVVDISYENSEPTFRIVPNQAYDYIRFDRALAKLSAAEFPLLLHGTLALRSATSRKTLSALLTKGSMPVFADLNRRLPWWDSSTVEETLGHARWVKINEQELQAITRAEESTIGEYQKLATELLQQYKNIEILFVTLGAQGAFAVTHKGQVLHEKSSPIAATELDTVGGGDAFCAVAIIGLLEKWAIDVLLQRANEFAAAICRVPGATTTDKKIYQRNLQSWQNKRAA